MKFHTPVMAEEVLFFVNQISKVSLVVDATVGDGGHSKILLDHFPKVRLVGIDRDKTMIERAKQRLETYGTRVVLLQGNFATILANFSKRADAVIFDFGVASFHFDESSRGFSFLRDEPLDMRLDTSLSRNASEVIKHSTKIELTAILREFGEERFAARIASAIKAHRGHIDTTGQLFSIIESAIPRPARFKLGQSVVARVFQSLRIKVNDELSSITKALPYAVQLLKPGGVVVAISFHSLEDRLVKNFFRESKAAGRLDILTKKPLIPSTTEQNTNRRSRSAKLRVARRTEYEISSKAK